MQDTPFQKLCEEGRNNLVLPMFYHFKLVACSFSPTRVILKNEVTRTIC